MSKLMPIVKGATTFVPGVTSYLEKRNLGGSTHCASYCYSLWLKHLTLSTAAGLPAIPYTFGELGPGASLGVGIASLLCGSTKYYALDLKSYANTEENLRILEELLVMLQERRPRPTKGWPDYDEYLQDGLFPHDILSSKVILDSTSKERVEAIRKAVANPGMSYDGISINYLAPWNDAQILENGSIDLLLSHSTLEHVEDLDETYRAMAIWVKKSGWMSHQIDLSSHGITKEWDGYRRYSEFVWKVVKGQRVYWINRATHGQHKEQLIQNNFKIMLELKNEASSSMKLDELATRWKSIPPVELACKSSYFAVQKLEAH